MTQEAEKGRSNRGYAPLPITEELVTQASSGDEQSMAEVVDILTPRIGGYFLAKLPGDAEDLTQLTLSKITKGLDRFKKRGDAPYADQFRYWSFAIARNVLRDGIRSKIRRSSEFTLDTRRTPDSSSDEAISRVSQNTGVDKQEQRKDPQALFEELLGGWVTEHLETLQAKIVQLRTQGMENRQIAQELGVSAEMVQREAQRARTQIEQDLLTPAGLRPLMSFRDDNIVGLSQNALNDSSKKRRVHVIKILGQYYTTETYIQEYLARRRDNTDQRALDEGYLFIGDHCSLAEYSMLLKSPRYRKLLLTKDGRYYINPDDLDAFRRTRTVVEKGNTDRPEGLGESYVRLVDVANSQAEYKKYTAAIKRGVLAAQKIQGGWYVTREMIENYERNIAVKKK